MSNKFDNTYGLAIFEIDWNTINAIVMPFDWSSEVNLNCKVEVVNDFMG